MDTQRAVAAAQQQMMQMVTGYWTTQIVLGAAYYSLADHLSRQPMTVR